MFHFFFILHVISINLHRLWASYCRSTQTVRAERCGLYHIATSALTFTIMNGSRQWAYTTLRLYRLGSVCTLYRLARHWPKMLTVCEIESKTRTFHPTLVVHSARDKKNLQYPHKRFQLMTQLRAHLPTSKTTSSLLPGRSIIGLAYM